MATFNQVILVGNLTRDPEVRVTPKGTSIAQFGLAVNRQFKDESGQQRDESTFVDIEAWAKQAELVSKYLKKGSAALIKGRLKLEQWDDKQSGQKRSKLKVVLEEVQFLGRKDDAGSGAPAPSAPAQSWESDNTVPLPRPPAQQSLGVGGFAPTHQVIDDDLPF